MAVGVVVRRYINFLILLIPTLLVSILFCSSIPNFCSFLNAYKCYYNYNFCSFYYYFCCSTLLYLFYCI